MNTIKPKIPVIDYNDLKIGVTRLDFCKWRKPKNKSPSETPYTEPWQTDLYESNRKETSESKSR